MNDDQRFLAVTAVANEALVLTAVFVLGLVFGAPHAAVFAAVSAGFSYLSYMSQFLALRKPSSAIYREIATVTVVLSWCFFALAALIVLVNIP